MTTITNFYQFTTAIHDITQDLPSTMSHSTRMVIWNEVTKTMQKVQAGTASSIDTALLHSNLNIMSHNKCRDVVKAITAYAEAREA